MYSFVWNQSVSFQHFHFLLACILFDTPVRSLYIFWNINYTSMSLLCFPYWVWGLALLLHLSWFFLSLWFWIIFIYSFNNCLGIHNCRLWCNIIDNLYFTYTMEHLFKLSCEAVCIYSKWMCTIHLLCCHNVWFFISEEVSCSYNFVFDCCNHNHFSNYFFLKYPITIGSHKCFRESIFSCGKIKLRFCHGIIVGTPNYSRIP